jgi:hypothetical protein
MRMLGFGLLVLRLIPMRPARNRVVRMADDTPGVLSGTSVREP